MLQAGAAAFEAEDNDVNYKKAILYKASLSGFGHNLLVVKPFAAILNGFERLSSAYNGCRSGSFAAVVDCTALAGLVDFAKL